MQHPIVEETVRLNLHMPLAVVPLGTVSQAFATSKLS